MNLYAQIASAREVTPVTGPIAPDAWRISQTHQSLVATTTHTRRRGAGAREQVEMSRQYRADLSSSSRGDYIA